MDLHDNIANKKSGLDALLLIQSPVNLWSTPLLRTRKQLNLLLFVISFSENALLRVLVILRYVEVDFINDMLWWTRGSQTRLFSLCHVLDGHVDVDPEHVVGDETEEDKDGDMHPPDHDDGDCGDYGDFVDGYWGWCWTWQGWKGANEDDNHRSIGDDDNCDGEDENGRMDSPQPKPSQFTKTTHTQLICKWEQLWSRMRLLKWRFWKNLYIAIFETSLRCYIYSSLWRFIYRVESEHISETKGCFQRGSRMEWLR